MSNDDEPLDRMCNLRKYRSTQTTWRQVVEQDPDYARWAMENADSLDDDVCEALQMALEDAEWAF